MSRARITVALAAVYLIWGSTFLAIRVALETFSPLFLCGLRFSLAGLLLYACLRVTGARPPTRREWMGCLPVAVLLLVVGSGGIAIAEGSVASSACAILFTTVPLWAALFTGLLGGRVKAREWLGLAAGTIGVALLHLGGLSARPAGVALVLFAAAGMALGSVLNRRLPLPTGAMASAAQLVLGGGLLLLLGLARAEVLSIPSARSTVALAYLILFGSIAGYSAYGYLLRHVRPALATSNAYVNPIVAVILGSLCAAERITLATIAGMATILAGLAFLAVQLPKSSPQVLGQAPEPRA